MIDEKNGEKFGGMENNTYLCRGINKERTNMTTMTLNIQDNSIMPYLLEMLGKVKEQRRAGRNILILLN